MIKYLIPLLLVAVVLVSGCTESEVVEDTVKDEVEVEPKTEDQAKLVATELSSDFNSDDYGKIYDRLLLEAQERGSKEDFITNMERAYSEDNPQLVISKVEFSEEEVFVHYSLTYRGYSTRLDPAEMVYVDGEWKVRIFEELV
jgi:hypothetical protein